MSQQNQAVIPYDSSTVPLRRKRGRPRKYDNPTFEPRRRSRPLHPRTIPVRANSTASFSYGQGGSVVQALPTPAANTSYGHGGSVVQALPAPGTNPNRSCGTSDYVIQALPIAAASSSHPSHGVGVQPASHSHAGFGHTLFHPTERSSPVNPTTTPYHDPHGLIEAATSNPCYGPNGLLGKAVSGILDGTFDSGYLVTVRVGDTGQLFKGIIFDPCISIPLSRENDIAPLVPMAGRSETPSPVTPARGQASIPMSIDPVPNAVRVAQPLRARDPGPFNANYGAKTYRFSKPKSASPLSMKEATSDDGNVTPEMRLSLQAELRDKILQALLRKGTVTAKPQEQTGRKSTEAGSSCAADREKPKGIEASREDQAKAVVEALREQKDSKQCGGFSGETQQLTQSSEPIGTKGLLDDKEQPETQTYEADQAKRSSDQKDQSKTQFDDAEQTGKLPDNVDLPNNQTPGSHGFEGSSGQAQQSSVQTTCDLNRTEFQPGQTRQLDPGEKVILDLPGETSDQASQTFVPSPLRVSAGEQQQADTPVPATRGPKEDLDEQDR